MRSILRLWRLWERHQNLIIVFVALTAAWLLALASGFWFFFRLAYVLSALVPLSFLWAWANLRGLEVSVHRYAQRVQVGEDASERVSVANRSPFPKLWLEVEDPSDLPGYRVKAVISLSARGRRSWRMAAPCLRRGLYTIGPLTVRSGDPFGLFHFRRTFGPAHSLVVYPLPEALPHFWVPPAELAGDGRQRRPTHFVTPSAASVRDYEPGDSFGRIHWPSTARLGRLMVKTFDVEPASDVWVVLDLQREVQAGAGDESTEEYGVRVACSVANHFLARHRPVGYVACGAQTTVLPPDRGRQHLARVLEALALARGVGDVPLTDLLNGESGRFGRHSTLVVITPSAEEGWVAALEALVERGVKVTVVALEAASFGGRRSPLLAFSALAACSLPTYWVRRGDNLAAALGPQALGRSLAGQSAPRR
jgi:uncharacterized protein (DUF58 family)